MKHKYVCLIVFAFLGCNNATQKQQLKSDSVKVSVIKPKGALLKNNAEVKKETSEIKNRMQGVWTDGSDVNASFLVKGDTINFIEQPGYHYQIKGDSIKIAHADYAYSAKILFKKDTLIIDGEDGPVKYWRFKD